MRIFTNLSSINTARQLSESQNRLATSIQRLSSGLRINQASDDAAGMSIAERMTSQIRGTHQAIRNANDGISLTQTAEGALQEVGEMLQRMRELTIQAANATNSATDKRSLQAEVDQLKTEINRINNTTQFAGIDLFAGKDGQLADPIRQPIIDGLKGYWLEESVNLIEQYYGITASGGVDLEVVLYDGALGGVAASVTSSYTGGLDYTNLSKQTLDIDIADFVPANLPNGGTAPVYNDRIIAHEMVHAIMARTMDLNQLRTDTNTWFTEGISEFIQGGDERVLYDLANVDGNLGDAIDPADYGSLLAKLGDGSVEGSYSAGYIAVAYMHDQIKAAGGEGIKDVMQYLAANPFDSLGDALAGVATSLGAALWGNNAGTALANFEADVKGASGIAFFQSMDLTNEDTGAVGGFDRDGGAIRTAESVLQNVGTYSDNPTSLNVVFPVTSGGLGVSTFSLLIGDEGKDTINFSLSGFSVGNLGLADVDITGDVSNADLALVAIDRASEHIEKTRGELGALQNRLISSVNYMGIMEENTSAARSRIQDADYAIETAILSRNQILQQAGISMLAQANVQPQTVLSLLR